GDVRLGDLFGCAGGACLLGGSSVSIESIAWIGLATAGLPPSAQQMDVDEVHLDAGAVHPGELGAVTDRHVFTAAGGFDRSAVEWIHLTGPEETPPSGVSPVGGPADENLPDQGAGGQDDDRDDDEDDEADEGRDDEDDDGRYDDEGGEDQGGEDQGGEDDAFTFDPSGDVATPGNRSRQRLATSGRSQGGEDSGGEDECISPESCPPCESAVQDAREARARAQLYQQQHAVVDAEGLADHNYEGHNDEEHNELRRLWDVAFEAGARMYECWRAYGLDYQGPPTILDS
ncbi:MAG: hypothetical protein ACREK3_11465, partial [Gemmatimonadota bacterium]